MKEKIKYIGKKLAILPTLGGSYIIAIGVYYNMLRYQHEKNKRNK